MRLYVSFVGPARTGTHSSAELARGNRFLDAWLTGKPSIAGGGLIANPRELADVTILPCEHDNSEAGVARAPRPGGPEVIKIGYEDLAPLKTGELLVRVVAAGLSHAETSIRSGKYAPIAWAGRARVRLWRLDQWR
jgi:hypothetical protein